MTDPPDDLEELAVAGPVEGLGERLALLREQKNRKISSLAREIGVSPSLVSQIERGQSRPSVSTLFAMSEALGVPVDAFFRDGTDVPPPAIEAHDPLAPLDRLQSPQQRRVAPVVSAPTGRHYMVRQDERATIDIEGGVRWERLTPTSLANLEFLELVYGPKAESNSELYRHPGTEMVVITEGRLDIYIGFDRYELGPGDSIHFPSAFPHRYVNPTEQTTRAITVILHDPDAGQAPSAHGRA